MSEISELDKILEDHARYKHNMRWNKLEANQRLLSRFSMALLLTMAVLPFGWLAVLAFPLFWWLSNYILPPVKTRDPFGRYQAK